MLSLWQEARNGAALPPRSFIDPLRLRRWVGDISVVQVHEGPKRFFVSLHGANVVRHLGPDFNRQYLEDAIPTKAQDDALKPYCLSMELKKPTYSIQRATLENGLFKSLERMILPCCDATLDQTERFLVWVAPIKSDMMDSTSVYNPFEESEIDRPWQDAPRTEAELFVLSEQYRASV